MVARSMPPVTAEENTIIKRVPAVTGIARPVIIPLKSVPTDTNPVREGARVTVVPATGAKLSSGVVEL